MKRTNFIGILHNTIKTIREVVANIFFIVILILLAIFMQFITAGLKISKPSLPKQFTLIISPKVVKEELTTPPITEFIMASNTKSYETSIHDLTKSIRLAKNDSRIKALWLDLSFFTPDGFGIVEEFAQALEEFKLSEKPIYVYSFNYNKLSYFIASLANQIWLDPFGSVNINGFSESQIFMADALSRFGIEANIIKAGRYKNFGEGFERSQRSESSKEMTTSFLESLWVYYVKTITGNRQNLTEQQRIAISNPSLANRMLAPSEAESAMQLGLVDHLGSRSQALKHIFPDTFFDAFDDFNSYNQDSFVYFEDYFQLHEDLQKNNKSQQKILSFSNTPTIAVIHAHGGIVSGYGNKDQMGSYRIIEQIQTAVKDKVQAIVLRVDSGGGSAYASEEIYRVLMDIRTQHNIPIIISMGSTAASGAYWISLAADEIIAHPSTLTGSIGVFSAFFSAEGFAQKWGLYEDAISVPRNDINQGSLFKKPSQDTLSYHQASIDFIYKEFLGRLIKTGRATTLLEADALAQGRVYTGLQAKELGLVDDLGNLQTAIERASVVAEIPHNYQVKVYAPSVNAIEQFIYSLFNQSNTPIDMVLSRMGLSVEMLQQNPSFIYALEPVRIQ